MLLQPGSVIPGIPLILPPILRTISASGNAALIFLLRGAVLQPLPSRPGVLVAFAAPSHATGAGSLADARRLFALLVLRTDPRKGLTANQHELTRIRSVGQEKTRDSYTFAFIRVYSWLK